MQSLVAAVMVVLALLSTGHASCPESEMIHCRINNRCTRIRYICDGDNDCGDHSDESIALCNVWHQPGCERGHARCYRHGTHECITISRYCSLSSPPCLGDVDPRVCQMLRDEKLNDIKEIEVVESVSIPSEDMVVESSSTAYQTEVEETEALGEEFEALVNATIRHDDCPNLFTRVADTCISIFFPGNMTWGESREFCKTIGGDLLILDHDFSFYGNLIRHIRDHQVTSDFWVGGSKLNDTTPWTWINDSIMELGSPYWTIRYEEACNSRVISSLLHPNTTRLANHGHCYHYSQAPSDPPHGYCAALTYKKFHYMSDESCLTYMSPLCIGKKI